VAKKKKKDLPAYVLIEMPEWKSRVLNYMLMVLNIPGQAWVIAIEDTGFTYDGESFTDEETGLTINKISKKVANGAKLTL